LFNYIKLTSNKSLSEKYDASKRLIKKRSYALNF